MFVIQLGESEESFRYKLMNVSIFKLCTFCAVDCPTVVALSIGEWASKRALTAWRNGDLSVAFGECPLTQDR